MATLLDASLVAFLLPLFVFLFIFVVIYALLTKTKLFGEKQTALNFLAAICIAAVASFAGNLITLVGSVTPWIVFIILVLVLIFGMYKMFGLEDKQVWDNIGGPVLVYVVILIIILIGLTTVFEAEVSPFTSTGEPVTDTGSGLAGKNVKNEVITTLTHPRLLGALFILLVAAFTVKILVDKVEEKEK